MADGASLYGSGETSDDLARKTLTGEKKDSEGESKINSLVKLYLREIDRYNRSTSEWYEEAENIEKVYLDELNTSSDTRKFALLWTNIETLKPAVYSKLPTVLCSRRYKDRDIVARTAAELMERATNTSFDIYGADEAFKLVRDDRLLPGRGQGWVRYEATIERYPDENEIDGETEEPVMHERLKSEKVCVDYVHWQDFGHNVARIWSETWLVWRIVYKTEEEVAERWGPEKAAKLSYNARPPFASENARAGDTDDYRCKIYELWDKLRGLTSWLADGQRDFLESGPPPISFRDGFPCPMPCYATKTSRQLVPRPDYRYYRDQAKEINDLTDKIHRLTQWLIVKGFVPGGPSSVADPLEEALRDKSNAELFTQVDSFKEWSERGGAAKLIDWLPIQHVVATLTAAINARNQLIQDVFQLTGISDILRGQSDPNETLGAQELKAQTGSRRQKNTRDDINRWCRDMALLCAEVIAEVFSPRSIAEITGYKYVPTPPPQPLMLAPPRLMLPAPGAPMPGAPMPGPSPQEGGMLMPMPMRPPMQPQMGHNGGPGLDDMDGDESLTFGDDVIALLRNDKMRSFRIDVETDQTGQADENLEKQRRVEMLNVVGGFLERGIAIVAKAPEMGPVIQEFLQITARGFRTGKGLEDILDRAFRQALKSAQQARAQAQQMGPPEVMQAKMEHALDVEKAKTDAALEAQKQQTSAALEIRKQNIDAETKMYEKNLAAAARARENAERILGSLKSGTMQ
jgi:hypothetical protein